MTDKFSWFDELRPGDTVVTIYPDGVEKTVTVEYLTRGFWFESGKGVKLREYGTALDSSLIRPL